MWPGERFPIEQLPQGSREATLTPTTDNGTQFTSTWFEVDELCSSEHVYDPFLIVSCGEESYYVEVWNEPAFEHEQT